MICRAFPHAVADGPQNMGLDLAILDSVDADPSYAVFRTYEWSAPTLSLGYFQSIRDVEADLRWQGVPVVRRPSGGSALWHDRELTYALVVPRSHSLALRPTALYRAVHAVFAEALNELGIAATRRGERTSTPAAEKPFLCFLDDDPEDVLLFGTKIVGSAQRRRPAAVLQHGSLLLSRSVNTPELDGLLELAGASIAPTTVAHWLGSAISKLLDMEIRQEAVPLEVQEKAAERSIHVYQNADWTNRR